MRLRLPARRCRSAGGAGAHGAAGDLGQVALQDAHLTLKITSANWPAH
jgi:hypothetical protein